MPTRTAPNHPQYDGTVQRSVKNVYDRDPLLIPQLFAESPPWYRGRAGILLAIVVLLCAGALAFALSRYGLDGAAQRMGRVGTGVLRTFARTVGR
jgi:hypothetical protein